MGEQKGIGGACQGDSGKQYAGRPDHIQEAGPGREMTRREMVAERERHDDAIARMKASIEDYRRRGLALQEAAAIRELVDYRQWSRR